LDEVPKLVADHLFDGFGGTWSITAGVFGTEEFGTPITVTRSGTITGLRLNRPNTTMETPTRIALWSVSTWGSATLIESIGLAPLGTNTGWFEFSLGTPVDAVQGETYIASLGWNFSHHKAFTNATTPQPWTIYQRLTDKAFASSVSNTGAMSLGGYISGPFQILPIDLVFEPVPYGDFGLSELTDELARWLTAGGDKYPESDLPAIKGQAEGANSNAESAWTTAQQVQTDLGEMRDEWTGALATKLGDAADFLRDVYGAPTPLAGTSIKDVVDNLGLLADVIGNPVGTTIAGFLSAILGYSKGTTAPPALAETPDWELVDETDFTNNLLWPVEADIYRVTLSDFDPAGTIEQVGTETRHAYLGKWCPFNVQFSSEWHYFNTESADLYLGGRMPGLGLILYRPGAGHVQAWRRTEAP
jgi:hypothetical protein